MSNLGYHNDEFMMAMMGLFGISSTHEAKADACNLCHKTTEKLKTCTCYKTHKKVCNKKQGSTPRHNTS